MSKGSGLRPTQVSKEELANNWEKTFGKKKESKEEQTVVNNNFTTDETKSLLIIGEKESDNANKAT